MRADPDRSVRSLAFGALRSVLLAVAAAWALWLVAAQALLWTPLLRNLLNVHSPGLHLEYAWAWSVWPGTVHARGLVLTGQDRAVQWRLALEEVKVSIALGQLPSRVFHATRVRARGLGFALRRRAFVRGLAEPESLRGLPRIAGLETLPYKEEGPDDELPESRYRLFTVWLEDVEAGEVRQIWIDRWRLEGAARVAGAFYLKPMREVLVAPGILDLGGAAVTRVEAPVASDVEGRLSVSLDRFDPRKLTAERIFRALDARADLGGRLAGLEAIGGSGGAGPVQIAARVGRGRVEQGTVRARLEGPSLSGVEARRAALALDVGSGGEARLEVESPAVRGAAVRAGHLMFTVSGENPDLGALRLPRFAAVDVREGRIDHAGVLARRLLHTRRVQKGGGSFSAHLEGPPLQLRGRARVSLSRLQVAARGVKVRANARIDARISSFDPRRGGDLSGTRVSVDDGRLVPDQEIAPGWWGRAVLPRARLQFARPRLDADLEARCRDARPIVGLYAHLADLPGFLNSLFAMDGLSLRGSAHAGRGWLSLPEVKAEGNGASVRATLRRDGDEQRGAALLTVSGISVALDLNGGGSSLQLFGPGDFFAGRQREVRAMPLGRRAPRLRR